MQRQKKVFFQLIVIIMVLVLAACYMIRLPYFIQSPGKAQSMTQMVKVRGGYPVNGDYSLVYIYLGQANVYEYLWAKMGGNKYTTLVNENAIKLPNEDDKAYNLRQENYMTEAQQSAAYIAYKEAGKKPKLLQQGVLVLDTISAMPNAKVLKSGDLIVGMENHKISSTNEMERLLKKKKLGDHFDLTIIRNKHMEKVNVQMAKFPKSIAGSSKSQGIGIYQSDQFKVDVKPPVRFNITNIGGPSAGLMMTLDIYDQLTRQDLAKGRNIAGTGTIELDGTVGPIGGIADKIVGANKSGVKIFFAPVADHEYDTARETAKAIGSHMKIVPVRTFNDAKNYLLK